MESIVSLAKSPDHLTGVKTVLKPLETELKKKLASLNQIVIKINFVSTHQVLATTPIGAVQAFIDFILPFYQGEIVIAEEASLGNTKSGFDKYGFSQLAKERPQVRLLDLADDETIEKTIPYPGGELNLPLAKTLVEAPFLVSIVRPKTHDTVVVTLGLKNVFVGAIQGGISWRSKIHQGKNIHWIMANLAEFVYPNLVVIDGTEGMEGDGPTYVTPIKSGWSIASFDALAADSLSAYLMGFQSEDIGYFCLLHDKNYGRLYPVDEIKILGGSAQKLLIPFQPHPTFDSQRSWQT